MNGLTALFLLFLMFILALNNGRMSQNEVAKFKNKLDNLSNCVVQADAGMVDLEKCIWLIENNIQERIKDKK